MRSHLFHSYATLHGVIWSLTNKMQNVTSLCCFFHVTSNSTSFTQRHKTAFICTNTQSTV